MKNKRLIAALVISLFGLFATPSIYAMLDENGNPTPHVPRFRKGILLLQFKPGVPQHAIDRLYARFGITEEQNIEPIVRIVRVPDRALLHLEKALSHHPAVEFVERDEVLKPEYLPNDPSVNDGSVAYHLTKIQAPEAWDLAMAAARSPVIVAAPDTGVDYNHLDLKDILRMDLAYNFYDNNTDVSDVLGHGTATAGVLGAHTDNGIGVPSLPLPNQPTMIPMRISDLRGYGFTSTIAAAINYAAQQGVKVVSVSYGVGLFASVAAAAKNLRSAGGLTFVAAGNESTELTGDNFPELLVVGAADANDNKTSWSNWGTLIDLVAPGVSIETTNRSGGYGFWSGTSFSTPLAASVAALLFSVDPGATPSKVEYALFKGAKDLGNTGWDSTYGYGRVDALGAMQAMANAPPVPVDDIPPIVSFVFPREGDLLMCNTDIRVNAADLVGMARVELYVNGSLHATDTTGSNNIYDFIWDISTIADGPYTLEARAYDTSNNTASASISVQVAKELNIPQITITSPADGSAVGSKSLTVTTAASDNTTQVDFHVDNTFKFTDTQSPFEYGFSTRPYAGSTIPIKAVAFSCVDLQAERSVSVTISGGRASSTSPQCSDSKDNDSDGLCDYAGCYVGKGSNKRWAAADPQCASSSDTSESA